MADIFLGVSAALISAVLWGTNFVPMKLKNVNPFMFHAFMTLGIFLSSIAYVLGTGSAFSLNAYAIIAGISWGAGNLLAVKALELSGLSRALPVWAGIIIFLSFVIGLVIFNETLTSMLFGGLGILMFLIGLPLVSAKKESAKNRKGILIAIAAGIIFSFYLVPFKIFSISYGEWLFSSSIGIVLTGIAVLSRFRETNGLLPGMVGGVMWNAASLGSLYAVTYLGYAIGAPLTQLALVVSALWGIFYFKEVKGKLVYRVMLGVALLFIAGFLLSFSKI